MTRLCALLVALWLHASPLLRWITNELPSGNLVAVVARIGGVSAALLGGAQAVSGATYPTFDGPFEVNGTVGQSLNFRLNVVPYPGRDMTSFSASNLPPGISIVRLGDNSAILLGTPSQAGNFESTVYGWRYSPASDPRNYDLAEQNGVSDSVSFTITGGSSPPSISIHPQGQRRLPGTNATFSVTASGTGTLTYHWRKNSISLGLASASTLTLTNLSTNNAGTYSVVVSNSAGSVTSSPAILSIASRPVIDSSRTGSAVRLGFTAETGVTYRVESSTTATNSVWTTVTNLTPATDGPLAVTNTPASSNLFYRLRLLGP